MQKIENFDEVSDTNVSITVGPHKVTIIKVDDDTQNQFLKVEYDITEEGPLNNYFAKVHKNFPDEDWKGVYRVYYKDKAIKFFKRFITSIEKSNPGFEWTWDETKLVGKTAVLNYRTEEYVNKNNEVKTIVRPFEWHSTVALAAGAIKTDSSLRTLEKQGKERPVSANPAAAVAIDDKDLPF
jgi:hypothetical protein